MEHKEDEVERRCLQAVNKKICAKPKRDDVRVLEQATLSFIQINTDKEVID